jgi:hypothetical protein
MENYQESYIKNFNQFLAEKYNITELNDISLEKVLESIDSYVDNHENNYDNLNEAAGSLTGLPQEWTKIITNGYNVTGGENSIRTTIPIKATQKKKVFDYFKNGYNGTPVLALMGFIKGEPAIIIYRDQWDCSLVPKWKLMIGKNEFVEKLYKERYSRERYSSVHSNSGIIHWTENKNTFSQKDIINAIPDGDYEMQLITADPERIKIRQRRKEIADSAGIKSKTGIQKSILYKHILGKVKPQVDSIIEEIGKDIHDNMQNTVDRIFGIDKVTVSREIDIEDSIKTLNNIIKKLTDARYLIDSIFPNSDSDTTSSDYVQKMNTDNSSMYDKRKITELKELLKNGIKINYI